MASCVMQMPIPKASHDEKCHLASHFDHLDLRNVMMPLIMPSIELVMSHDHFDCLDLSSAVVHLTMASVSCDHKSGTNGVS